MKLVIALLALAVSPIREPAPPAAPISYVQVTDTTTHFRKLCELPRWITSGDIAARPDIVDYGICADDTIFVGSFE